MTVVMMTILISTEKHRPDNSNEYNVKSSNSSNSNTRNFTSNINTRKKAITTTS